LKTLCLFYERTRSGVASAEWITAAARFAQTSLHGLAHMAPTR
jgi:hypothetical protein